MEMVILTCWQTQETVPLFIITATQALPTLRHTPGLLTNPFTTNPYPAYGDFHPTIGDVDGDGLLDVVVGNSDGNLLYYKNTGTTSNPVFTGKTSAANPFAGIDVGRYAEPALVDLDADGDLDIAISSLYGSNPAYFKNTGTKTAPIYVQQTGSANPLDNTGRVGKPTFGDVDKDGDLDLVTGN